MAYYGPVTQGPPIASPSLPAMGRGGDTVMGHLTPGEVVIPTAAQSPPLMQMVNASMQQQGMDPRQYTVGPRASQNPRTGYQEFSGHHDPYGAGGNQGGGEMGGARGGSDRDGRDFDRTPRDTSYAAMIDAIGGDAPRGRDEFNVMIDRLASLSTSRHPQEYSPPISVATPSADSRGPRGRWTDQLARHTPRLDSPSLDLHRAPQDPSIVDPTAMVGAISGGIRGAASPPHRPHDPYGYNDREWGKYKTPAVGGLPGELELMSKVYDKLGIADVVWGDDRRWEIPGPWGDPLYGIDISAVGGPPGDRERESGAAWPHDDIDTTFSGLVDAPWGYSRTAFPPNQPPDIPDYPGRDVPVTYNGINYGGFHPQKVSYQDRMDRGWFADLLEDWGFPADPNDIDFDSVYNPATAVVPAPGQVGMSLLLGLVRTMGDYFGDGTGEDHIYPGDEPHEHPVGAPHENRHKYYDEGPGDRK